jgi:hypothetical protein
MIRWGAYGGSSLPPFRGPRPPKAEAVRNRLTRTVASITNSTQLACALAVHTHDTERILTAGRAPDRVLARARRLLELACP